MQQIHFFDEIGIETEPQEPQEPQEPIDLLSYDTYIVMFSGGKDSIACYLYLLEAGVPNERIELWHHDIDGREGSHLMDWPCTPAYCRCFAEAFGVPIYFSWREGGFEREMLRHNAPTAAVRFETPDGSSGRAGGESDKLGTRLRFPQVASSLSVRWCSSALKIDVAAAAIRNQERFNGKRTLCVTGERAEESAARACYASFEAHRTDLRAGKKLTRHVDHYRPVHAWNEAQIWAIIERWRINPHPAYRLGWGRVSCAGCIFGGTNQWASLRAVNPVQFERIATYEEQFGCTIRRDRLSIRAAADLGTPYATMTPEVIQEALDPHWSGAIIVPEGAWTLPAGAFGDTTGPT
jgi:3'-phosphoadenosine 5'-phosphosulfate sulfotransferase (PAPS reductase)/FAD synthetase